MLTWELVGAIVGAGIASGREIAAFFAPYGIWGYAGILMAICLMMYLGDNGIHRDAHKALRMCWHGGICALLISTGGAMLSAAGELTSMMIPLRYGGTIGAALTLTLAWLLGKHSRVGLSCVSKMLIVVMGIIIVLGLCTPADHGAVIQESGKGYAAAKWLAYGGFNAALLVPVFAHNGNIPRKQRRIAKVCAGIIILCLLALGNLVLNLHSYLISETLPFVKLASRWGIGGFLLASISMYLAVLSTLTACVRALPGGWHLLCMIVVSAVGFKDAVAKVYPIVGFACLMLLLISKYVNCASSSFQSTSDVL